MKPIGIALIFVGISLIIAGAVLLLLSKWSSFGNLPGDIMIKGKNFTFYFPVLSMILLSVIITILINIFTKH
jgi:hypothetical protein